MDVAEIAIRIWLHSSLREFRAIRGSTLVATEAN